jgi:hypothetical protein
VSTGYTVDEYAAMESAAGYLDLTIDEFQTTGVYVIDFLTQLGKQISGDDPKPLEVAPDTTGPEVVTFTWDEESREVMDRVSLGYEITPAEAQKFGAFLLTFFVSLEAGS